MKKFVVTYGEYNKRQKKKAANLLLSTEGIVKFSIDMEARKLTVIGDANPADLVSKLNKLGHAELVSEKNHKRKKEDGAKKKPEKEQEEKKKEEEKKQKWIKFRKILSTTSKFIAGLITCTAAGYGIFGNQ